MYLKNKFCVLLLVALLARVFAQDTPQDNPYRVRDIIHSFGQAVKGAVSIIIYTQLMQKSGDWSLFCTDLLGETFFWEDISLCFIQTKKGQTSIQTEALSEMFTSWLVELKESGLVSDEEVHQAAPKGMKVRVKAGSVFICKLHWGCNNWQVASARTTDVGSPFATRWAPQASATHCQPLQESDGGIQDGQHFRGGHWQRRDGRRRGGCHAWGYPGTCTCTCTSTRFLNRRPDFDYWAVLEQLSEADKNLSYEMNKCPYSNRLPTTRGTLSWPQPSDKVVEKPTDIWHIDAIFLLYQASVKSNSEMIFCLGITKENT